jgi:hypothetical protein
MIYGETFLRNFKFYAKTLTKLHDLTVASLAVNDSLTAYVGAENRTAEFCRLLEQEGLEDPKTRITIRWAVRAAGAVNMKLVLKGLPTTARAIRKNSRLCVDTTPGLLIKSWPLGGPMASTGISSPIPVLFSLQPEETKALLDQDPTALKTGLTGNPQENSRLPAVTIGPGIGDGGGPLRSGGRKTLRRRDLGDGEWPDSRRSPPGGDQQEPGRRGGRLAPRQEDQTGVTGL